MTRRCGWTLTILLSLTVAGHAVSAHVAAGRPSSTQGVTDGAPVAEIQPVWIEPGAATEEDRGVVRVNCEAIQGSDRPVVFQCEFRGKDPIDNGILRVTIRDAGDALIYQVDRNVVVDREGGSCQLEWDAGQVLPGVYKVSMELLRPPVFLAAHRDYMVHKISPSEFRAQFEAVLSRLAEVTERLKNLEAQGATLPYMHMHLILADDFTVPAREALDRADWPRAYSILRYLQRTTEIASAELESGNSVPEFRESIPRPPLRGIEIRDGEFYAEGRPVFLLGAYLGDAPTVEDMTRLGAYGLNFAAFVLGPNETLNDASTTVDLAGKWSPVFQRAEKENLGVAASLAPRNMPAWVAEQFPMLVESETHGMDITKPEAFPLIEKHLQAAVPYLAKQKSLIGLSLMDNPEFKFTGEEVRLGFLDLVKSRYKDRHAVNQAWKGLFADLNEVQIGWTHANPRYQESPAYRYDWQRYHQLLGSEFLERLRSATRARAPQSPLTVAFSDKAFEPGEAERGVDREALIRVMDMNACCASNSHVSQYYGLGYPQEALLYTLMRSLAPDKPLVNLQDRIINESVSDSLCTYDYVHSVLWEGVMAGLNGSALYTPLAAMRPECLEAYATACLDLNRLAPIVAAFQQAPAEVAILWSMSSTIFGNGTQHLESARFAFEGCSFAGYKLRFITEKQCRENQLADIKVLVVPDTPAVDDETFPVLKDFMQGDGVVVRTASSILYDEHGHSRRDIISAARRTVLVHGQNLPAEYLHAMDAVAASGALPPIPRTVNEYDYPLEGVKSRYLELDGKRYLYLINLRKTPAKCHLHGANWAGRDLIHGRNLAFPVVVAPLEPMLIRLDMEIPLHAPERKGVFERMKQGFQKSFHQERKKDEPQNARDRRLQ